MAEDNNQQGTQEQQLQFSLQRIYVKDISFEAPNSPRVCPAAVQAQGRSRSGHHQRVGRPGPLRSRGQGDAQVSNNEDDATAFLVEVEQAGLFRIAGLDGAQLDHTLGAFCPNVLFPYARECIDSLVGRGSFPPLMLAPVNFEAMYAQKQQRAAQARDTTQ
ncbi:protein-export chaperone SecB [Salinicola tamaricis]|uniref:protein-export chaperone SecB n=1 Tax=Salinicola tamaricis TaxID=1771309 RepID=UPI000D09CDBA|nr:protein-export chaperone SecB [Salinicola tamaricis]